MEEAGQSREEISAQMLSSCPNRARRKCSLSRTAGLTGREGQVARGSRDDSSPQEPCYLRNMISKCRWKLLAMLAFVLVVMVWYSISREDRYIELFYFPILEKKEPCLQGEAERKASKLFGNYSQEQPIFLQLKDYFWVKTPSAYELPYGTKGSEDLLLRVLAITSYSIPESIQRLKCRRCVVVGNGHRLRNSLLGEAINKYDVVIRLNNAPVAGYEGDVGSKTTMRLFYPESAHFNPKVEDNPDTLLVLVAFKAMDFHWIESILSDKKRAWPPVSPAPSGVGLLPAPLTLHFREPVPSHGCHPLLRTTGLDARNRSPPRACWPSPWPSTCVTWCTLLASATQMPKTRRSPFTTMSKSPSSPWRGQATMSPKRPWPSSGCWKSERSRTSHTSDLDRS
ncbi:CMP-N-acetylneuraminate-beta-galactosamide-alpha-2,3-sialyltransferase 4 isoform X1 [Phacochoerus africanus]|uniref:CMP-N-acetylneuraminate-beta-galactosamide- alpha-2,3-sialyltransferase 4 isoform X1 n=1 Tax=Phacochoerus africanus TaxID=41426 RepID=UPI001FDAC73F|nr:CMP-N-acetylneuraminate-beta-galactosamide-alpha-2,3-sialyltransferase 4 isoform X1 [Phacochoerus africanus]